LLPCWGSLKRDPGHKRKTVVHNNLHFLGDIGKARSEAKIVAALRKESEKSSYIQGKKEEAATSKIRGGKLQLRIIVVVLNSVVIIATMEWQWTMNETEIVIVVVVLR
jgi:hypothetical protein